VRKLLAGLVTGAASGPNSAFAQDVLSDPAGSGAIVRRPLNSVRRLPNHLVARPTVKGVTTKDPQP